MSEKNHPNINAAGLAAETVSAIYKFSRNNAQSHPMTEKVSKLVVGFCTNVSQALDEEYGISIHPQ